MVALRSASATPVRSAWQDDPLAEAAPPECCEHKTPVAGTRIAWTEQGTGSVVILLHGLGDSRRTWRKLAPYLAESHRVLMPDLPGHGDSGRPDAPYTVSWFAAVVSEWMEAVGVPHAHLVGHSFGGGVAQCLLHDHRDRIDRLVLVATGGLGHEVSLGLRLASLPIPERLYSPALMWMGTMVSLGLGRRAFAHQPLPEMRRLAWMNGTQGSGRAFCRTVRGVINLNGQTRQTREGIGAVAVLPPVALFWGAEDPIIPVAHGRQAREVLPGATLEVFADCGHFPHQDKPAEMAASLRTFLSDG